MMVSIWGRKRKIVDKKVYQNGSIDTNIDLCNILPNERLAAVIGTFLCGLVLEAVQDFFRSNIRFRTFSVRINETAEAQCFGSK